MRRRGPRDGGHQGRALVAPRARPPAPPPFFFRVPRAPTRAAARPRYFLRARDFATHAFEPSAADVEHLSIDDFNDKYQESKAYTIDDIEDLIESLVDASEPESEPEPAAAAPAPPPLGPAA